MIHYIYFKPKTNPKTRFVFGKQPSETTESEKLTVWDGDEGLNCNSFSSSPTGCTRYYLLLDLWSSALLIFKVIASIIIFFICLCFRLNLISGWFVRIFVVFVHHFLLNSSFFIFVVVFILIIVVPYIFSMTFYCWKI